MKSIVKKALDSHQKHAEYWFLDYLTNPRFEIHDVTYPQLLAEEELFVYLQLVSEIDSHLDQVKYEFTNPPSCPIGCHHCCNHVIHVTQMESRVIETWMRKNLTTDQLIQIKDNFEKWHQHYLHAGFAPELDASNKFKNLYFQQHLGCPFLAVDGKCAIYPVRPSVCRTYFSYDLPFLCSNTPFVENTVAAYTWDRALILCIAYSYESSSFDLKKAIKKINLSEQVALLPFSVDI